MGQSPPRYNCKRCSKGLYLLQPVCKRCDVRYEWSYEAPCYGCGTTVDYTAQRCPDCGTELSIWLALELDVLGNDRTVAVWKESVPRPTEVGYRYHVGSVHGQWADYRRPIDDGEFHVRSFADRYELHCDDVSAIERPASHLLRHGPTTVTGTGFDLLTRLTGTVVDSSEFATRMLRTPVAAHSALKKQEKKEENET